MLVTDSCSALRKEEKLPEKKQGRMSPKDSYAAGFVPALTVLLLSSQGTININSSHPNKGNMNLGELAMAWVPIFQNVPENRYLSEVMWRYNAMWLEVWPPFDPEPCPTGTVFTNAFLSVAEGGVYIEVDKGQVFANGEPFSPERFREEFLKDLRENLSATYKEVKDYAIKNSAVGMEAFMMQQTQTLTRFDDRGVALP
jgi:hypothetical protein